MTKDQIMKYLGAKWTPEKDCYWWFITIQREEFGRQFPALAGQHGTFQAARLLKSVPEVLGARKTATPVEGDAVFLSQRTRAHHIGTVVSANGKLHVLHAVEGAGVILSNLSSLKTNGWRVDGYWTQRPD